MSSRRQRFGGQLTGADGVVPKPVVAVVKAVATPIPAEEDGEEVCFICASAVPLWGVGECSHRTCSTCAIRLRALYKRTHCTFCNHPCPNLIITPSFSKAYSDFSQLQTPFNDPKLSLRFEQREDMISCLNLLRFNCPECDLQLNGWADLKRHTKSIHIKALCDLCCLHKKVFSHEHLLYTSQELNSHMTKDHAPCAFCGIHFYDSDLLYAHCRDRHEECFICMRNGIRHQYHLNYDKLEAHFNKVHYLCPHATCLGQKFVVFETELDLQAHSVSVHNTALSGDQRARKEARRIETNFTYEEERNVRGGGSGGAGFGGAGPSSTPRGGRSGDTTPEVREVGRRAVPGLGPPASTATATTTRSRRKAAATTLTPEEPAVASTSADPVILAMHTALLLRVSSILTTSSKLASFKSGIRGYKTSEMSAQDLADQLYNIFDEREVGETSEIVQAAATLLDQEDGFKEMKGANLMVAWKQVVRSAQNNYPSLGAQSSSSAVGATANWGQPMVTSRGKAPPPQQSINQRFPKLSISSSSTSTSAPGPPGTVGSGSNSRNSSKGKTPWSASNSTNPSRSTTPVPSSSSHAGLSGGYIEQPLPVIDSPSSAIRRAVAQPSKNGAGKVVEFPKLLSDLSAVEKRERVRKALGKPGGGNILDPGMGAEWEDEAGFYERPLPGGSSTSGWNNSGGNGGGAGGSGSGTGGNGPQEGQQQKKKKGKVLLMSSNGAPSRRA